MNSFRLTAVQLVVTTVIIGTGGYIYVLDLKARQVLSMSNNGVQNLFSSIII